MRQYSSNIAGRQENTVRDQEAQTGFLNSIAESQQLNSQQSAEIVRINDQIHNIGSNVATSNFNFNLQQSFINPNEKAIEKI